MLASWQKYVCLSRFTHIGACYISCPGVIYMQDVLPLPQSRCDDNLPSALYIYYSTLSFFMVNVDLIRSFIH